MRLIDADALMEELGARYAFLVTEYGYRDHYTSGFGEAADKTEAAPTIDAVPVVRCKDCKHFANNDENDTFCRCIYGLTDPDENDFCSNGERRSE